jgi:hypothetical protein
MPTPHDDLLLLAPLERAIVCCRVQPNVLLRGQRVPVHDGRLCGTQKIGAISAALSHYF